MKNKSFWMILSGATGFSFFLIANFTNWFSGSSAIAGILQLGVNAFVFIVWLRAFRHTEGFTKFIAFCGVIAPPIMAFITIYRVLIPFLI